MKLNKQSITTPALWPGYILPTFDVAAMTARTRQEPIWLHIGAGNIVRAMPATMQQSLLEQGLADRGIIITECYDEEIIPLCYTPQDNISLLVTLKADGGMEKQIVASVAEAFNASASAARFYTIFAAASLQMVTFTITEKGYAVTDGRGEPTPAVRADLERGPWEAQSAMGRVTAGCLARFNAGGAPLALVSLDNCSRNGDKVKTAVQYIAAEWLRRGFIADASFIDYLQNGTISYPWSMIDKITPRPSAAVAQVLATDGFEDTQIITTTKKTYVAAFVNAEVCQYLVIEDNFPNGRPPLEKAGCWFTDRETVEKVERMKVCTCLNPLHTMLAAAGCLLGYATVAESMRDVRLQNFLRRAAFQESLAVVTHPGIIDPENFLREVLEERLPNPYIPDTPERIICDSSQKIPVRFGETLKARLAAGLSVHTLTVIPFFFALWLRYLLAVDDAGNPMPLSPDPRLAELTQALEGLSWGGSAADAAKADNAATIHAKLKNILSDASIFGVNLYDEKVGLGECVETFFAQLTAGVGAVNRAFDTLFTAGC